MSNHDATIPVPIGFVARVKNFIALLRPAQWVKNGFLLAPLVFSKHLFEVESLITEVLAVGAFSLVSSSVYVLNDVLDRDADREHPVKKHRPVASGLVSPVQALVFGGVVFTVAILIALNLNAKFQAVAVLYVVINIGYSLWLKRVLLVDVFLVAGGFMLRVLAGAFVIDVKVSHWLVLCTLFVSLFLAASKRRGEILLMHSTNASSTRAVLKEYDIAFLDQVLTVTAAGMAISYALYTVAERTVRIFGSENLIFTTVFVLFGIFRYLYVMRRTKTEDNPTLLLLRDPIMLANVLLWFVACIVVIYFREIMTLMGIQ